MTLCRAAVQDVLVKRLWARRGLDLQLPLQGRPQRLVVPHRQVPPLGLPPDDRADEGPRSLSVKVSMTRAGRAVITRALSLGRPAAALRPAGPPRPPGRRRSAYGRDRAHTSRVTPTCLWVRTRPFVPEASCPAQASPQTAARRGRALSSPRVSAAGALARPLRPARNPGHRPPAQRADDAGPAAGPPRPPAGPGGRAAAIGYWHRSSRAPRPDS